MKFKMGSSKDDRKTATEGTGLHDSTSTTTRSSTGTGSTSDRFHSQSGLYDVSRMTNIKSPVDSNGHNVSHFTKARADDDEKRSKAKSELLRGILVALAVPLIAGAGYLQLSGQNVVTGIGDIIGLGTTKIAIPTSVDRQPAAKATLPAILPLEVPATAPAISIVGQNGHSRANETPTAQPLKIELDSNGILISPFSVELDENGDEVSRTELRDRMVYLPPLPLGPFDGVSILSKAEVPESFRLEATSRPFVFQDAERRRISELRAIAPEIKKYLNESDSFSNSRLSTSPQVVESFTASATNPQSQVDDMFVELKWMRAASLARDISGDRTVERRLMETVMLLARRFRPTGSPIDELPLLDAVFAYDHIRHLWSTPDQTVIDGFFREIVDKQFTRIKAEKTYSEIHAAQVLFALSIGYVIQNRAFVLYGITQYTNHVAQSKILSQESFGPAGVRTVNALLRSAYVLERSANSAYPSARLHQATTVLVSAAQADSKIYLLETVGAAAYFRSDLYGPLAQMTRNAGIAGSRFGTGEGALLAASRHVNASLLPSAQVHRLPTNAPTKLPPKRN